MLLVTTSKLEFYRALPSGIRFLVIFNKLMKEFPRLAVISSCPVTKTIRTVLAFSIICFMKEALIRFIAVPLLSMNPGKSKKVNEPIYADLGISVSDSEPIPIFIAKGSSGFDNSNSSSSLMNIYLSFRKLTKVLFPAPVSPSRTTISLSLDESKTGFRSF